MAIKIIGLGGALTDQSSSLWALQEALDGAKEAGAEVKLYNISEMNLPMLDLRNYQVPDVIKELCSDINDADAMIWSSPLYHGTVSGSFKNALDWLEELRGNTPAYLTNKFIGLICTAGGSQGLQAINTMEYAVRALRGFTVPLVVPIAQSSKVFDEEGHITDEKVKGQLHNLSKEIIRVASAFQAGNLK